MLWLSSDVKRDTANGSLADLIMPGWALNHVFRFYLILHRMSNHVTDVKLTQTCTSDIQTQKSINVVTLVFGLPQKSMKLFERINLVLKITISRRRLLGRHEKAVHFFSSTYFAYWCNFSTELSKNKPWSSRQRKFTENRVQFFPDPEVYLKKNKHNKNWWIQVDSILHKPDSQNWHICGFRPSWVKLLFEFLKWKLS